ncbi:Homeodomain-like protein [Lasiosphaeris hirsuta]|uniref:Homeodomain-like protein n=1 Tax=Lasiosphaeris hirsuta TaxID=260670 RepID=A0AA40A9S5_9PEZI|nr:Homeodomain-like protein [Lasiosphaeris hirsuta]
MSLVQTRGPFNWVRVATNLGSRTPKQCRERYHQTLKPTLNHAPITPEEGILIEQYVNEIGKRWAEIARRLPGRSDDMVKGWWNGSQNRRRRVDRRKMLDGTIGQFEHIGGFYPNLKLELPRLYLPPLAEHGSVAVAAGGWAIPQVVLLAVTTGVTGTQEVTRTQ